MAVGFLIASAIAALVGGIASVAGSAINADAVKKTNSQNIAMQNATNETQLDIAKHGLSYRMEDAEMAGLNPIFAATGGPTTPTVNLQSPKAQAPLIDVNGIANAVTALNNTMLTKYLIDNRNDIAQGYMATSRTNNESRNTVLKDLYRRKAKYFTHASDVGSNHVNSAKQISDMTKKDSVKWDFMMKELKKIGYKY